MDDTENLKKSELLKPFGNLPQHISVVMGFDWGKNHIGVAIGNTVIFSAHPLTIVNNKRLDLAYNQIRLLRNEWLPNLFIVGMPFNKDGSIQTICYNARKFGQRLHSEFGVTTVFVSEVYSSSEAKLSFKATTLKQVTDFKKNRIDDYAATEIIEFWFKENKKQC